MAYARARWYDARNASWLSEDPMLDVDSPNLYAFVQWQPNMGTDPLGLCGPQCANTYRVSHMSPQERNELTEELLNLPFAAPRRVTELASTRQAETGSVYAAAALDVVAQGMPETGQGFVAEAALAVATEGAAPVLGKIVGWGVRKVSRLGKRLARAGDELLEAYRLSPEAGSIPGPRLPGTPAHRAARWQEYQARGGDWSYERWTRVYEENLERAKRAHKAADDYHRTLGWGRREVTVDVEGVPRRLDIADEATLRAREVKTGYQSATQENLWEIQRDQILREKGWDLEWYFEGTANEAPPQTVEPC
jgi:hypothetical protein